MDRYLRRSESLERVIGTLVGTRTETTIEVRNCFAVSHNETAEQVAVDMDYHHTMFELHQRVNPKDIIVGWYVGLLVLSIDGYFSFVRQVFDGVRLEHIFCPHPKFLLTRDGATSSCPFGTRHGT